MISYTDIYDISVAYGGEAIDYPGDIPFERKLRLSMKNGEPADVSSLHISAHSGTHLDLPSHFNPGGKSINEYHVNDFIISAHVIGIKNNNQIPREELESASIGRVDALLFKTENSRSGKVRSGQFSEQYVYVTPEAADFCIEYKPKLIGIDYSTVDKYDDESYAIHRKILGNNIMILEGINLAHIPEGEYTLVCLPLKIEGGEASPVRAILLC